MAIAPFASANRVQNPAYRPGDTLRPARGCPLRAGLQFSAPESAADEAFEELQRRFRLLLLRHVSATLDQPQGGVGQRAPELDADLERHDAIVVAPQDERRQRDGLEAIGEGIDVGGHDLPRALDD